LIHAVAFNPERLLIDQLDRTLAFEFLATLQSCCWGSMATLEANTPRQALTRLGNLAMAGEHHLKPEAADQLVSEAIDIVVHLMQFADGSERIVRISEVMPIIEGEIGLRDLFVFKPNGHADGGRITGTFGPTGIQPTFLKALQSMGIDINSQIFEIG
jgi:pilus assembly protein CpaF